MSQLSHVITSLTILVLVASFICPIKAQAASDHAEAIVGKKIYKFDWDYQRDTGDDDASIVKNTKSHQETVSAKSGSIIGARIFFCCEDGSIEVGITKDKVKVTHPTQGDDEISFGKIRDAKLVKDCDSPGNPGCLQEWQLPKVKKGSYTLVFQNLGSDEFSEYYLTKIKVSK